MHQANIFVAVQTLNVPPINKSFKDCSFNAVPVTKLVKSRFGYKICLSMEKVIQRRFLSVAYLSLVKSFNLAGFY